MTFDGVTHEFFGMETVVPQAQEAVDMATAKLREAFGEGSGIDAGATDNEAPEAGPASDATPAENGATAETDGTAEPADDEEATNN